MLLIPHFITLSIFFLTVLGGSTDSDKKPFEHALIQSKIIYPTNHVVHAEEMLLRTTSAKDAKKFADQQISVVGKLGCAGAAASTVKAKTVLKISRNGEEITSARYPSNKQQQQGSLLISAKRTEPKFLFLQIIPDSPKGSKCDKTIQGKVRMREFKAPEGGNKKDKVFDVGDCDFSTGECSKFSVKSGLQTVSIVGSILCANNQAVRATVILKPKRRGEKEIKSQPFDYRARAPSLLETQTKEPNTVFLRIVPDPAMGPTCNKTIEGKLGIREFKQQNGKGVFDVGKCDLSTGKCTEFPFPQ